MNRRSFMKAIGVVAVSPLGLVGKAVPVPVESVPDTFTEYNAPVKKLTRAEYENLLKKFRHAHANTTFRKPIVHYDLGIRHYYVNPKLRKAQA